MLGVLRPSMVWMVRLGSASSILVFQSSVRLVGQMMRAGYWFVYSVVARACKVLPSPISSAMKVRCFSAA